MADKKISQLSTAASLTGAEAVPIVQTGATLQATVYQLQTAPMSALTANTVMYLNGSKVPTSSTSLAFDGTNLGIGVTPMATGANGAQLQIGSPTVTSGAGLTIGCTTTADIQFSDATSGAGQYAGLIRYSHANDSMGFWTASAVRATIDSSGNLGIGTSSPAFKLDVDGSQRIRKTGAGYNAEMLSFSTINETGAVYRMGMASGASFIIGRSDVPRTDLTLDVSGNVGIGTSSIPAVGSTTVLAVGNANGGTHAIVQSGSIVYRTSASTSGVDFFNPNASPIQWYTSGTGRMTLDASGNLGLGVTPNAWVAGKAIQVSARASLFAFSDDVNTGLNTYYDGTNFKYIQTGFASLAVQTAGQHRFFTAPSGTAGNTISFTQAMTLDASGNLLVGTTAAGGKLTVAVADSAQAVNLQGATGRVRMRPYVDATNGAILDSTNAAESAYSPLTIQGTTLRLHGNGGTGLSITAAGNHVTYQPAESAQNTSVTLSVTQLQARIITSNAAVTLTLPTGTTLESYATGMVVDNAFEVTFIATTASAITIAANGNTTVGSLTVAGNTSGTFRFRKTATNTFTVYRIS